MIINVHGHIDDVQQTVIRTMTVLSHPIQLALYNKTMMMKCVRFTTRTVATVAD